MVQVAASDTVKSNVVSVKSGRVKWTVKSLSKV